MDRIVNHLAIHCQKKLSLLSPCAQDFKQFNITNMAAYIFKV